MEEERQAELESWQVRGSVGEWFPCLKKGQVLGGAPSQVKALWQSYKGIIN